MRIAILIFALFFSGTALGQNKYLLIEKDIHGDTILGISLPDTTFFIDCNSWYKCHVGCDVCFATDSLSKWELDSFMVEDVYLWRVDEVKDKNHVVVFRSNFDSSLLTDYCLTDTIIEEFKSFITYSIRHGQFNGKRDIIMKSNKIRFNWIELIEGRPPTQASPSNRGGINRNIEYNTTPILDTNI